MGHLKPKFSKKKNSNNNNKAKVPVIDSCLLIKLKRQVINMKTLNKEIGRAIAYNNKNKKRKIFQPPAKKAVLINKAGISSLFFS